MKVRAEANVGLAVMSAYRIIERTEDLPTSLETTVEVKEEDVEVLVIPLAPRQATTI